MINNAWRRFQTGTYDVARDSSGARSQGLWSELRSTTSAVPMSIQPADGRALAAAPPGTRADEVRLVLCDFDLRVDDVVTYEGEGWRCYKSERWDKRGALWTEAHITRKDDTVP